ARDPGALRWALPSLRVGCAVTSPVRLRPAKGLLRTGGAFEGASCAARKSGCPARDHLRVPRGAYLRRPHQRLRWTDTDFVVEAKGSEWTATLSKATTSKIRGLSKRERN